MPVDLKASDSVLRSPCQSINSEMGSTRFKPAAERYLLNELKNNRPWGQVQTHLSAKTRPTAKVVDYSKAKRDKSRGKENGHLKGLSTSRETKRLPSLQKFKSECNLPLDPKLGKCEFVLLPEATGQWQKRVNNQDSAEGYGTSVQVVQRQASASETVKELEHQWHNLLAKSEALEFVTSKAEARGHKDHERVEAVVGVLRRAKDKVIYLLRSLFRGEVDEECRVKIAAILGQIDEVTTTRNRDKEEEAFASTRAFLDSCNALLPMLVELDRRRENIVQDVRDGSPWFAEFRETLNTLAEAAAQEESTRLENITTLEESEHLPGKLNAKDMALETGMTEDDVAAASRRVYEEQANRIKREGEEKMIQYIKRTREGMSPLHLEIIEAASSIANCPREATISELEGLDTESNELILSLWSATVSLKKAVASSASPYEHAVDLRSYFASLLQDNLPMLGLSLASFIAHPLSIKSLGEISYSQAFLTSFETYLLVLLRLRTAERIQVLLHESLTSNQQSYADSKQVLSKLEQLVHAGCSKEASPSPAIQSKMLADEAIPATAFGDTFGNKLGESVADAKSVLDRHRSVYLARLQAVRSGNQTRFLFSHLNALAKRVDRIVLGICSIRGDSADSLGPGQCAREIEGLVKRFRDFEAEQIARKNLEAALAEEEAATLLDKNKELARYRAEMRQLKQLIDDLKKQADECNKQGLARERSKQRSIDKSHRPKSKSASRQQATKGSANHSIIEHQSSFIQIKAEPTLSQQIEAEDIHSLGAIEKAAVDELKESLAKTSVKNAFFKKLMKHLEAEFNLEQNCTDWLSRGLTGIRVRRGAKTPFGYTGSKKMDPVKVWTALSSGLPVDLEKMGFAARLIKFDNESQDLLLMKPAKRGLAEDWSQPEQLSDYSFNVNEVGAGYSSLHGEYSGSSWAGPTTPSPV